MVWRSEDQNTFGIEADKVGTKVFDDENLPFRLFDAAHESKNLGKKLKDLIEKYGWVTKLGKRNRLHMTLLIQTEVDKFHKSDCLTPNKWINLVDSILSHCKGDHQNCNELKSFGHINYMIAVAPSAILYLFETR